MVWAPSDSECGTGFDRKFSPWPATEPLADENHSFAGGHGQFLPRQIIWGEQM
jgi:hypothetical protein